MGFTELTLRLLLLFFPGIVCFLITEALTVHRERKAHEVLFLSYVYGMLSYLLYAVAACLIGIRIHHATAPETGIVITSVYKGLGFFGSLTDSKVDIDFWEIGLVALSAIIVAYIITYYDSRKLWHRLGHWLKATNKFGDPNVWTFVLNSPKFRWCVVRDIANKLMYQGYIANFSDVDDVRELLLTDVVVYNEGTTDECYRANSMYLARKKDELTVEFQDEQPDGDQNVGQHAQAGVDNGGHGEEGGDQPAQPEQPAPAQAGGQLPHAPWQQQFDEFRAELRADWRKLKRKMKR